MQVPHLAGGYKPTLRALIALYGTLRPGIFGSRAQRELGQRRGADVDFYANTGRSVDPRLMSARSHKRT